MRIQIEEYEEMPPLHAISGDFVFHPYPKWDGDWAWRYDFPEIWQKARMMVTTYLRRRAQALWWKWARRAGIQLKLNSPHLSQVIKEVEIDIDGPILEVLGQIYHHLRRDQPIMVVIGPDRACKLERAMLTDFAGIMKRVSGVAGSIFLYADIPIVVSPHHRGDPVVLPDLTNRCRINFIENAAPHKPWQKGY